MVGDGERIAAACVAEAELTFEISAAKIVGVGARRERRSLGAASRAAHAADQAVAIEHGVDGALRGDAQVAGQPADQQLANLARAPMRLAALEADDQPLDLRRELVGVADRPAGSVGEGCAALVLVAGEEFVAGFAGDAELAADVGDGFSFEDAGDEAEAFFHGRTRFPRHPHLPPERGKALPMCPERDVTYVSGRPSPSRPSAPPPWPGKPDTAPAWQTGGVSSCRRSRSSGRRMRAMHTGRTCVRMSRASRPALSSPRCSGNHPR